MADFKVIFRVVNIPGVGERPIPNPPIPVMNEKDTVAYSSPDGVLKLTFTRIGPLPLPVPPSDSPFASGETIIRDANARLLASSGHFHCACEITKSDGTVVKWLPGENIRGGGGDHDVRPPSGQPA